jgi:oligopeptide transport system ATP-binding protein
VTARADGPSEAPAAEGARRAPQILQAEGLSKLYPVSRGLVRKTVFVHAVEDVTFYVRRGETLGLVGESGSGKSTIGRLVLRLVEPTLGRVVFDGVDLGRLGERELRATRRRMQIVFQDPLSALDPRMTVAETVGEGVEIFRLAKGRAEHEARVGAALEEVGLPRATMGRFPHELSGGQRQRVGLARALAVDPELLVCDEPVSALDVSVQAQILNLLAERQEQRGLAMLFISHDLRVVAHMAHRTAVMYLGRIVEMGPTVEVAERRVHPYTRALYAAAPTRDGGRRSLEVLSGEPPSALEPPPGCAFHPRCPRFEPGRCDAEVPALREVVAGSHHRVACFHPVT